jgi:hypothetical protein
MKAIIEFTLPEEREEFDMFNKASFYYSLLTDIDNYCRSIIKHGVDANKPIEEVAENIRGMIHDID